MLAKGTLIYFCSDNKMTENFLKLSEIHLKDSNESMCSVVLKMVFSFGFVFKQKMIVGNWLKALFYLI